LPGLAKLGVEVQGDPPHLIVAVFAPLVALERAMSTASLGARTAGANPERYTATSSRARMHEAASNSSDAAARPDFRIGDYLPLQRTSVISEYPMPGSFVQVV